MSDKAFDIYHVVGASEVTLYHEVRSALAERLYSGMGYPHMDGEAYMSMLAHDGADTVARDASDAVSERVQELLAERLGGGMFIPDDPMANLINEMFDFANRDLWADVTVQFLPENEEAYTEMLADYGIE